MVNTIHPVDVVVATGLPTFGGRQLRQVGSVAFAGATAARPFGVRSGVRPGTSPTTVTATSTTWTMNPHGGLLDFEAAMESGPTPYAIDAAVTGAMRAADAFARVDLVWVRQDIPLEDGASVPAVVPGYTYGTVAGTPPTTPARCMVIAWINVPASGGGSPTVTWVAPYLAAAADAPGSSLVTPASVAGTGVTLTGGSITLAGTSSASVNGCFTAAFDNYTILVDLSASSAATDLNLLMRASGVDTDSSIFYLSAYLQVGSTTPICGYAPAAHSAIVGRSDGTRGCAAKIDMIGPALTEPTKITAAGTDEIIARQCWGMVRASIPYDGFTIATGTATTLTGKIRVYGFNNG